VAELPGNIRKSVQHHCHKKNQQIKKSVQQQRKLEKGKPSEKVGRKVTDLSLHKRYGGRTTGQIQSPPKILKNNIEKMEEIS
jgi:hypothetical protein